MRYYAIFDAILGYICDFTIFHPGTFPGPCDFPLVLAVWMEPIVGQVAAAVGPLETAALPPPLVGSVDIDAADADGEAEDAPTDSRRNWSPEVLLQLARIYRRMSAAHPELSRVGRMQLVYDEFKQRVDCSHRSRKAVDDKLYAMKQMYHFVVKMNGNFKLGGRKSPPSWFELTKEERRAVRCVCVFVCGFGMVWCVVR